MSTSYKYAGVDLNQLFSKNDADSSDVTLSNFKKSSVSLVYNSANGSITNQNNVSYRATPTNYFSNLSAYYIDYTYQSSLQQINVDTTCKEIRVLLCGAGGGGGGGAGDSTGQRGESGSGGGGGAYYYSKITITTSFSFKLSIGLGGPGVSGSDGEYWGNGGKNGIDGGNTILYSENLNVLARANGGYGGLAGHPDRGVDGGIGASGGFGTLISSGDNGSPGTSDRSQMLVSPGGLSGWAKLKNGNTTYPKYLLTYPDGNYGTGGAGSRGEYNPQSQDSGPGIDGWARIYFMY